MSRTLMIASVTLAICLTVLLPVLAQDQAQQPPPQPAQDQQKNDLGTLSLKVKYKGAEGAVDDVHKILVFVFDQPDIGQSGTMPIQFGTIATNGGAYSAQLYQSPVYIAVVYDKQGDYAFTGPPASGSPAGIYITEESQGPSPVKLEAGKTTEIEIVFDDSFRVP